MSFKFDWSCFGDDFYSRAKSLLTDALNKSNRPPILVDKILVQDLQLGKQAPELEILEIGDLAEDRFRGIFKLNYSGDASLTLATKIQANPFNVYSQNAPKFTLPDVVGATAPLPMPLNVTLSDIRLSGIIIMVFSKARGLTLVFRNDPLESIKVSSTFDSLPGIARFLQMQIETQIRLLFREELPTILHRLSHRWTPGGAAMAEMDAHKQQQQQQQRNTNTSSNASTSLSHSSLDMGSELREFSPSNMFKLNMMLASQRTLSLFTPSIPESAYRANLEPSKNQYKKQQTIQGASGDNLAAALRRQNSNAKIHPKKRVIKLDLKRGTKKTEGDKATEKTQVDKVTEKATEKVADRAVENEKSSDQLVEMTEPAQPTDQRQVVEQPQEKVLQRPAELSAQPTEKSTEKSFRPGWQPQNYPAKSGGLFGGFFSPNVKMTDDLPPPYMA
uniref:Mitochondrial distribution and morphology protein 34 n=1 Tax=Blastobotrys adeninivorans TaxID=409370 RepID=A0A060T8C2_BLAAD